ncbi:hypothetical protein JCM4814A_64160 [Streptomyces phaeofaciens JCM 4814]|uniref:Small hydrophobic protein n=1 Tax=Streptomyces phaeofaciens TaxID=68254 RepID=A0A918HL08_9ACTN|nr:small hydrophobic protein [Streptomyces phaeofaciens]GGT76826.1 hypothetical protein GCM10010226_63770 [Streptomyces phaeofaciens]
MAGFGHRTRRYPRSRGRMGSGWGSPRSSEAETGGGTDRATLGIVGLVCAVAGFFALGIVLGPAAIVLGRLSMGRGRSGSRPLPAVIAVALGAIDTLPAIIWPAGAAGPGGGRL